jgi:hypothetical protein
VSGDKDARTGLSDSLHSAGDDASIRRAGELRVAKPSFRINPGRVRRPKFAIPMPTATKIHCGPAPKCMPRLLRGWRERHAGRRRLQATPFGPCPGRHSTMRIRRRRSRTSGRLCANRWSASPIHGVVTEGSDPRTWPSRRHMADGLGNHSSHQNGRPTRPQGLARWLAPTFVPIMIPAGPPIP